MLDADRELSFFCHCHDFYIPILHRNPTLTKIISRLLKSVPVPQIPSGVFFACPECAALYVGRTENLRARPVLPLGQNQNPYGISPVCALTVCGTPHCGFQVEIYTAMESGVTVLEAKEISAQWSFPLHLCGKCSEPLRYCLSRNYHFEGLARTN